MHFYQKQGKQHVDLSGNLILTHNVSLISTRNKSAAPRHAHNAKYILLSSLTRWQKVKATLRVIGHIWSKAESQAAANRVFRDE